MSFFGGVFLVDYSRPPRGGRGLKFTYTRFGSLYQGRPPRGGRGLKFFRFPAIVCMKVSPPSRGAWIEICCCRKFSPVSLVAPPRGGRGLKLVNLRY